MPRGNEVKIGKIFGVEVTLDYSWFWIFALIIYIFTAFLLPALDPTRSLTAYFVTAVLGAVLFFGSVLAHELVHSLVARMKGLKVNRITLFLFGGVSNLTEEPKTPRIEFLVAIAGPLSSLAIGIILLSLTAFLTIIFPGSLTVLMIQYIAFINIALAVFNLIPGFPLDGGRVLRSLLWLRWGNLIKATRTATTLGKYVAYTLIVYGLLQFFLFGLLNGIWVILIGFFLLYAAQASMIQTLSHEILKRVRVKDVMSKHVPVLDAEETIKDLELKALDEHQQFFFIKDHEEITGVSSTRVLEKYPKDTWNRRLKEVMVSLKKFPKISERKNADSVLNLFNNFGVRAFPVYEGSQLTGIISTKDIEDYVKIRSREYDKL